MACWLSSSSHHLNQCYFFVNNTLRNIFQLAYLKIDWNLPGANELRSNFSKPYANPSLAGGVWSNSSHLTMQEVPTIITHAHTSFTGFEGMLAPENPTLWHGIPVASIWKSFGLNKWQWKSMKKLRIPCKFCTNRFIRYPCTCYVRFASIHSWHL